MRIVEIKGTNIELTEAIKNYLEEKLAPLYKLAERYSPCDVAIDVGKTTKHHQKGNIFYAEFNITIPADHIHVQIVRDDLYTAIDVAKDELKRQFVERKER